MSLCPPANPWSIIAASPLHAGVMAELHRQAFVDPLTTGPAWDVGAFADFLAMPGVVGHVILCTDQPLGLALWRFVLDEGELLTVGVLPTARGGGLGKALLCHGIDFAATHNVNQIFLEVAVTNTAAQALYASLWFAPVGRRVGYYRVGDRLVDADILALSLPG